MPYPAWGLFVFKRKENSDENLWQYPRPAQITERPRHVHPGRMSLDGGSMGGPKSMGYVFVLDDNDVQEVKSILTPPHLEDCNDNYRKQ